MFFKKTPEMTKKQKVNLVYLASTYAGQFQFESGNRVCAVVIDRWLWCSWWRCKMIVSGPYETNDCCLGAEWRILDVWDSRQQLHTITHIRTQYRIHLWGRTTGMLLKNITCNVNTMRLACAPGAMEALLPHGEAIMCGRIDRSVATAVIYWAISASGLSADR